MPAPRSVTLDTVGISIPCDDFDRVGCNVTVSNYGTETEGYRYSRKLEGGGFLATGFGRVGWVEASLPKRVDGENIEALPLEPALEQLAGLYDEASRFLDVPRGHCFDESKVVRLDLVRDFRGVDHVTDVLDGLAVIDQPGRSKVRRFADPSANTAETLRVGPRAWAATLYDKCAETQGRAEPGHLRFEARLHKDQLQSVFARANGGHVATVADMSRLGRFDADSDGGASLLRLTRAWFERVGFDRTVDSRDALSARIGALGLSPARSASLWCYLTAPSITQGWSRNTLARYRALADAVGAAPSQASTSRRLRLDFDACELIAA